MSNTLILPFDTPEPPRAAAVESVMEEPEETGFNELVAAIDALTPNQQHVLGCVASGQDGGHARATLKSLERRGLIVAEEEKQFEGGLCFRVARYYTPPLVHYAWCVWATQQPEEDEP